MYHPERAIRSAFIGGRKHGATAEAELDRILATSAPERRRAAWPQRVVIGTGAVAILIAGIALLRTVPAEAALTPPMLEMSPTNREAAPLLEELAGVRASAAPTVPATVETEGWSLSLDISHEGDLTASNTVPLTYSTACGPDGGITQTITAAAPFLGQDPAGLSTPGAVLMEESLTADEVAAIVPPLPDDRSGVSDFLQQVGETRDLSAASMIDYYGASMPWLCSTPAQEAAFLEALSAAPGITLRATTTDRQGRPAWLFSAASDTSDERLIVSSDDGSILGYEKVHTGNDLAPLLSAPAVTTYYTRSTS